MLTSIFADVNIKKTIYMNKIVICLLTAIIITLCSSCEKIKQNKEKYEQEKFEKELEYTTKIMEPILLPVLDMAFAKKNINNFDLNIETEALPNKTTKFTFYICLDESVNINTQNMVEALEDHSKNTFNKKSFISDVISNNYSVYREIKKGSSMIFKAIIKQGENVLYEDEFKVSSDDLHNISIKHIKN